MLTVKQILPSGQEVVFGVQRAEFFPLVNGSAARLEGLDDTGAKFCLTEAGRIFVMNGAGQTISKYVIESNSTEKHA